MPYISRASRERADWRTLAEAVEYIASTEGCTLETARNQIAEALDDGALWPLRWEDAPPTPRGTGGVTVPDDIPGRYWNGTAMASIDWQNGTVGDWSEYANPPRPRRLLVHRPALRHLWPPPANTRPPEAHPSEPAETSENAAAPEGKANTIAYSELKAALARHGKAAEGVLIDYAKTAFPGKHIPRKYVRQAIKKLWGLSGRRGRPPKAGDKSPE